MSARARAEFDYLRDNVRLHIQIGSGDRCTHYLRWPEYVTAEVAEGFRADDEEPLTLPEDVARAVYEALADHFGHSGHDTRALRKDYDAERKRVDRFIAHLTGGQS